MDQILALFMAFSALVPFRAPMKEQPLLWSSFGCVQARSDSEEWINREIERAVNQRDLWYGTPGVRAGEDMLGPILGLMKRPSGLLDFSPRKIPSYVDPELEEFNRKYRESQWAPKPKNWPDQRGTGK